MKYHIKSDLEFMTQDMKDYLCELATYKTDELELQYRPWRDISYAGEHDSADTQKKIEDIVGIKIAREFKRRKILLAKMYGWKAEGNKEMQIDAFMIPDEIANELKQNAGKMLDIDPDTIDPILQVQTQGNLLYPHCGHSRESSMFCLLAGDDAVTRWYEETEPFHMYENWRVPDASKIELAEEVQFEIGPWYTFNHQQWHSVHRPDKNVKRININLNFTATSYEELEEKLANLPKE